MSIPYTEIEPRRNESYLVKWAAFVVTVVVILFLAFAAMYFGKLNSSSYVDSIGVTSVFSSSNLNGLYSKNHFVQKSFWNTNFIPIHRKSFNFKTMEDAKTNTKDLNSGSSRLEQSNIKTLKDFAMEKVFSFETKKHLRSHNDKA